MLWHALVQLMIFFICSPLCQHVSLSLSLCLCLCEEKDTRHVQDICWYILETTLLALDTCCFDPSCSAPTPASSYAAASVCVSDLACFRVFLNTYCLLVCTGQGHRRQIKFSRECGGGDVYSSRQDPCDPPKTLVCDPAANWFFYNFHLDILRQFIRQFISTFRGWCSERLFFQRLSRPWHSCFSRFADFVSSKSQICLPNHFPYVAGLLYPSSRRSLQDSVGRVDSERWVVMLSCRDHTVVW